MNTTHLGCANGDVFAIDLSVESAAEKLEAFTQLGREGISRHVQLGTFSPTLRGGLPGEPEFNIGTPNRLIVPVTS